MDTMHVWSRTMGRRLPPMTGCAVLGPVLPLGHLARTVGEPPRRGDTVACPECAHLEACTAAECEGCGELAGRRVVVGAGYIDQMDEDAGEVAMLRLVYAAELPGPVPPEPAPAAAPAPAGPVNPEPALVAVDGRGLVAGYRFHLVEGTRPGMCAKPVRRAVHALRSELRDTLTILVGGDATRSISVAPDTRDLPPDRWAAVIAAVTGQLGGLLAATVPAGGRHHEVIPF